MEVMTRLATFEASVGHIEGGMRSLMDSHFEQQDRQVQTRLDFF